jgi:hypothetical protein
MTRRALFTWPYAEAEAAAVADKLGAAVAAVLGGGCGQGLTRVHFSAQHEPFLTQKKP